MSDFDDQFGPHVFEPVFQFNFFGNGHTVFGDRRSAKRLVDDDVAASRTHGYRHGVRQFLDAAKHAITGMIFEKQLFSHDKFLRNKCSVCSVQLSDPVRVRLMPCTY